ncbi:unnamed protein product [Bathycoccus prasinos]
MFTTTTMTSSSARTTSAHLMVGSAAASARCKSCFVTPSAAPLSSKIINLEKQKNRFFSGANVVIRKSKRQQRRQRRCDGTTRKTMRPPAAFIFWSQEDELRKRFKQIATVVADELAIAYSGNKNVKNIRKGILLVAEYPLFSVGVLVAGMSVAAAMASAVAVPIALAAVGTLLPLIMFASFGAIFAATAAAMVALTVLGPLLLSFSFFGGMSFVAVAAKAAIIVPSIIIGSTVWAIGSFGLKRSAVGGGAPADEEAKFENINAVGSQDDDDVNDDDESTNEFARTILDRFDRQLLGDVDLWDSEEVSAWLKSESLDEAASIAKSAKITGRQILKYKDVRELESIFQINSPKDQKKFENAFKRLQRLANVKLD